MLTPVSPPSSPRNPSSSPRFGAWCRGGTLRAVHRRLKSIPACRDGRRRLPGLWSGSNSPARPFLPPSKTAATPTPAILPGWGEAMPQGMEYKFAELSTLRADAGLFERFTDDLADDGTVGLKARKGLPVVLKTFAGRMVSPGRRFMSQGMGHQRRYCPNYRAYRVTVFANSRNLAA